MTAHYRTQKSDLAITFLATLVLLLCGCTKAKNYSTGTDLGTGINSNGSIGGTLPTPTPVIGATYSPTPTPSAINLGNSVGFSNNGSPLVPVQPPTGAQSAGSSYFSVTQGQTISLNLGSNTFTSTSGSGIPANSQYQVVLPNGAGVQAVASLPSSSMAVQCMAPQGTLTNGFGTICLQFTKSTTQAQPIPIVVNVAAPGGAQVTATLYVNVQTVLSPTVSLLRTCGRVARQNSATVNQPRISITFEVLQSGLPPMLLQGVELVNSNLYNQAGVLQPAALDLSEVSKIPNYLNLPVQINACVSQGPGTSCAQICNNPATLPACISRGTTSLAQSSGYAYVPVTVPLGALVTAAGSSTTTTQAGSIPVYLLSDRPAPAGYSAGQIVNGNQYCNLVSPLALTFHSGFPTTNMTKGTGPVFFDINATGKPQAMDFLDDKKAGFLVLPDANGNVTSGAQLFGPSSIDKRTGKSGNFENGFMALEQYVPAGRESIIPSDDIWSKLRVWFPNGNPVANKDQLKTLAEMHVQELSLMDQESSRTNSAGTAFRQVSFFTYLDLLGSEIRSTFVDIWFSSY